MSLENVRKLEEMLNKDEAMRERLKELSEAYDGDKEDERAVFDAVIYPLAEEVGLPYTYDEVIEYAQQKDDDEDLTADEASAVAGGKDIEVFCFIIGGGSDKTGWCDWSSDSGFAACNVIGVGSLYL